MLETIIILFILQKINHYNLLYILQKTFACHNFLLIKDYNVYILAYYVHFVHISTFQSSVSA